MSGDKVGRWCAMHLIICISGVLVQTSTYIHTWKKSQLGKFLARWERLLFTFVVYFIGFFCVCVMCVSNLFWKLRKKYDMFFTRTSHYDENSTSVLCNNSKQRLYVFFSTISYLSCSCFIVLTVRDISTWKYWSKFTCTFSWKRVNPAIVLFTVRIYVHIGTLLWNIIRWNT